MKKLLKKNFAPLLILIAASLWAIDGVIRAGLLKNYSVSSIVFLEHLFGAIILLPILIKNYKQVLKLNRKDCLIAVMMSLVSSVLGGYLFTLAFAKSAQFYDFITPNLLQKMQPIFVIILASIFLKEKISKRFLIILPIALIGSYLISFDFKLVELSFSGKEEIFLLSLGAAIAWGSGTILSKSILKKLDFSTATALRFILAVPISLAFVFLSDGNFHNILKIELMGFLQIILIVFTTGAFAIMIYYKGLINTQAKVATMLELIYPIVSVLIGITVLNPFGAPQVLTAGNIVGMLLLLFSITYIGLNNEKI